VPTLTCGLVRSNFCFAIVRVPPQTLAPHIMAAQT
jgi:hypothetical protein